MTPRLASDGVGDAGLAAAVGRLVHRGRVRVLGRDGGGGVMAPRERRLWGTFCPTCRTVRLRGTSVACYGGAGVPPHAIRIIEVIDA